MRHRIIFTFALLCLSAGSAFGQVGLTLTSSPNPSTFGNPVSLTASPVQSGSSVTFFDGTSSIGSGTNNTETPGPVSISTSTLSVGSHSLQACLNFSGTNGACSNIVTQVVNAPPAFTLTSAPNPSNFGQAVTMTASPTPSFTTVTFLDGGSTIGTASTQTGGAVSFVTSSLSPGTHPLSACYTPSSDSPRPVCTNTVNQLVLQSTSLALTSSQNPSSPCQAVTFTATISPSTATGSVTFFDGTTQIGSSRLANGTASVTLPSLTLGNHTIQAQYAPDPGYGASSATLGQTVSGSASATLSSSPNPSNLGQAVTISVTVASVPCAGTPAGPTPTGTVSFFDGATQIGQSAVVSGTATFSISSLSVGTHGLDARYNGDSNYAPVTSNTVSQVVGQGKTNTTTVLTSSANPITTNQPLTLTAVVTPTTATGQVQFTDGGATIGTVTLSGGSASLTLPSLTAGTHSLTAIYQGDTNDNTSTSNTISEVVNAPTSAITLAASPNPANVGQAVTLSATVTPSSATGSVQFFDGGTSLGQSNVANGAASLSVSTLTPGTHSLTAKYLGNTVLPQATSNTVSEVINSPTSAITLAAAPNPANVGQTVTLSATVSPSAATGSVQFFDGGTSLGQSNLVNGSASLPVSTFTAGTHTLTAKYLGDSVFPQATSNTVSETIISPTSSTTLSASPNPANLGQTVTLSATVTPSTASGSVQFFDGGTSLGQSNLVNGSASFSTSTLTAGTHSLTAKYLGDTVNPQSTSNTVSEVINSPASSTTLSASPNPANLGQAVTLSATVTPSTATGSVQFFDGGTLLGQSNLAGGAASLSVSTLTAGTHTLTAKYSGDSSNPASTSNAVSEVINSPSSVFLTVSPNPASLGQVVTLSAAVTPSSATGNVQFFDGSTLLGQSNLAGGAGSISVSTFTVGSHTLTAKYSGDSSNLAATSNAVTLTVNGTQSTTTSLSVIPNPANVGQPVTLSAAVSPSSATGTVTFRDGGAAVTTVNLINGAASFTTSNFAAGNHTITATYNGSNAFSPSTSNAITLVVNGASPTTQTSLSSSPNPSTFGQNVLLSASVTASNGGTPTGSVTFFADGASLGSGAVSGGGASFSISTLSVGTHTLVASYSGDATFTASTSAPVSQVVNKGTTTTTLTATPTSINSGQGVLLTARVTPSTATGTVTFMDGGTALGAAVPVVAGVAGTTTSALTTAGLHTITAVYSGDTNFSGSSGSATVTVAAGLTPTTTTLSVAPTSSNLGATVSLTASVAPAGATGTVMFLDNGSPLGSSPLGSNGTASFSTSSLTAGTHSLSAVYSGDTKFAGSSSGAVTETVAGKTNSTTSLTASPNPVASGQPVTLSASVIPATATGTVTFLDGGSSVGSAALSGGKASISVSLTTGSHTLTASYGGDTATNGSTSNSVTEVVTGGTPLGPITPTTLPLGLVGVAYSQAFSVTGGTTPLTWTLVSGSVPGLTLSPAGVLSGTPTAATPAGGTSLTIRVQDSSNPNQATATVLTITVLPQPSVTISTTQTIPQVSIPGFPDPLQATFTLSFTPDASVKGLPNPFTNPDLVFGSTGTATSSKVSIPANSTAGIPVDTVGVQLGSVAGVVTVTLTSLTDQRTGQTLPLLSPVPSAVITIKPSAPVITSVKITNITSSGFQVVVDATTTTRDLTSVSLTFTAASGDTLTGSTQTVSLTSASTAWFVASGNASLGKGNVGAVSVTLTFPYTGDPTAIGTVSVTLSNSVGTSPAVSGGR